MAFYDALAENGSATELMGNAELRLIASELVKAVRENSGMDCWHFDQRRKKVRTTIRRILRKYSYPPDLEDAAIRTVVLQAEALEEYQRGEMPDESVVSGEFGINLHLGGTNGTSSEGCCTLPPEQWSDFRRTLNETLHLAGLKWFAFILIEGPIN